MSTITETEVLGPAKVLRTELKEWEKAFAAANGGRKASREDVKKDAAIAQKYKDYNKLTGRLGSQDSALPSGTQITKLGKRHRDEDVPVQSIEKRQRQLHPSDLDPYDSPLKRTPSAVRTFVGPTPQKNGQVLGLFDLLSPADSTPSRKHTQSRSLDVAPAATPSRARVAETQLQAPGNTPSRSTGTLHRTEVLGRLSRDFTTPSAQRFEKLDSGSGRSRHGHDETPAFLRRQESGRFAVQDGVEDAADPLSFSPVAVRLPPRPAGKGLSALVQGLRHIEEERLDDELDLLREMEAEESGGVALPPPKKPATAESNQLAKPAILVEDSQILEVGDLPLGADGEGPESDDELAQTAQQPARKWKKRGQKRTTRKANIVPSTAKWKPEPEWKVGKEKDGDEGGVEDEHVGDEHENNVDIKKCGAKDESKDKGKGGFRKKISATAHANFRALKIRSKYGKGKGSGGGFRGRR